MKKQLFMSLFAIVAAAGTATAQEGLQAAQPATQALQSAVPAPGGMQQKEPNERTKETILKLQDALPLTEGQGAKIFPIFLEFYTNMDKARQEMQAAGNMDREKMKVMRDKYAADRDKQLAGILTADQMKKWTNDIEPSMHPQRRDGGAPKQ